MGRKNPKGKVIKYFTVEAVDAESDPDFKNNDSNPYAQLSEEERIKDFIEMFAILWVETCREKARDNYLEQNKAINCP